MKTQYAGPQLLPGTMVRAGQICSSRKKDQVGILPITKRTWYNWIEAGIVPQGVLIGPNTRVWPIETVIAIGRGEKVTSEKADDRKAAK